ncbi:MAG TPA: hypothetical protein PKO27_14495 [Deltaproteobacteria bacterium]|nr:hypothetical protein [Deltaproteobacteria bacterium]
MSYQPKVYKKAGGDELVVASGGKITIESGGELDIESLTNGAPGAGISGGTGTVFKSSVVRIGDIIKTSILIDLTGLSSSTTDGDIIGQGTAAAYLGQITAAKNGTILSGRMTCLEVPTGGADDIDLYSATEATGVFDGAIGSLTETALVTSGAAWALGGMKALSAVPAANAYLYLTGGEASAAGKYTAGKFLIELDGYEA